MRWLAILNPKAQNGVGIPRLRSLARVFQKELGAECAWTTYPRHADEIARRSEGFDGLIAAGGDGTIYEVVNGMDVARQCLGIVAVGTGNGLAHELEVLDIPSALHQLRQPRLAPVDLIAVRFRADQQWRKRYIVHTSALGYIADLVALGLGPLKPLGYLRYAAAACVQCCRQEEFLVRMRIDDCSESEHVLTNLAVNNTRYAGPFCLFPRANLQDGKLNLLYERNTPYHQLLEDVGILTQTYVGERCHRCPARFVSVDSAAPMTLMLDGELIPRVDAVRFEVVPGGLRCVVGKGARLRRSGEEQTRPSSPAEPPTVRELARY
jgi:diacylglycerol kinase (ATP)